MGVSALHEGDIVYHGTSVEDHFEEDDETPDITVEVNYVAPQAIENFLDIVEDVDATAVEYNTVDGGILSCHIILNVDLAYDEDTMRLGLLHSIGHCFGLTDDPGPPTTVELKSIMSLPLDPLGELTDHDRDLLLGYVN